MKVQTEKTTIEEMQLDKRKLEKAIQISLENFQYKYPDFDISIDISNNKNHTHCGNINRRTSVKVELKTT